jgi:hypothetical protein
MGICQSKKINPIIPIIVDELDKKNISANFLKTIEKVNRKKLDEKDAVTNEIDNPYINYNNNGII